MAKKKKTSFDFKYRLKSQYRRYQQHEQWLECSSSAKDKMEKMFPMMYDFIMLQPPEATPNMVVKDDPEQEESKE